MTEGISEVMTREEIEAKISKLEDDKFYIEMDDHWSDRTKERWRLIVNELNDLKKQLQAMG